MARQWLYEQMKTKKKDINPMFSMQSTLNWMIALDFEIKSEHGDTIEEQIESCRNIFKHIKTRNGEMDLTPIFGPMFHSLTFSVNLISISNSECKPWMFPSAIIIWYYAIYNAFKSILASFDGRETDTHSSMIRSLDDCGIRDKLPHPFNMIAKRVQDENYSVQLPSYPEIGQSISNALARSFDNTVEMARSMILEYLNGTCKYECDRIKDEILKKKKFDNFRTKIAREYRDSRLHEEINFLNCAFRYRGKANYRDAIFLTYGDDDIRLNNTFINSLRNVSIFSFICAFTYAEKRIGKRKTNEFLEDIKNNFRGQSIATEGELFWREVF